MREYEVNTPTGVPYRVQLDDADAVRLGLRAAPGEGDKMENKRGREQDKRRTGAVQTAALGSDAGEREGPDDDAKAALAEPVTDKRPRPGAAQRRGRG